MSEPTMTLWETDLQRTIRVLGRDPMLAQINRKFIEAIKTSVAAGVQTEADFRQVLMSSGLCITVVQLNGSVERAERRHARALASRDPGQVA